jgi:hypothetical protein
VTERINPETGVQEELGILGWHEKTNESGNAERVNPNTGVKEERGLFGWNEKINENNRTERVNPGTGVKEERGLFGWNEKSNENDRTERVNPGTGVKEERGLFGWNEKTNESGSTERINPQTGVAEERGLFFWNPGRIASRRQGTDVPAQSATAPQKSESMSEGSLSGAYGSNTTSLPHARRSFGSGSRRWALGATMAVAAIGHYAGWWRSAPTSTRIPPSARPAVIASTTPLDSQWLGRWHSPAEDLILEIGGTNLSRRFPKQSAGTKNNSDRYTWVGVGAPSNQRLSRRKVFGTLPSFTTRAALEQELARSPGCAASESPDDPDAAPCDPFGARALLGQMHAGPLAVLWSFSSGDACPYTEYVGDGRQMLQIQRCDNNVGMLPMRRLN